MRLGFPHVLLPLLLVLGCGAGRPNAPNRRLRVDTQGAFFNTASGYLVAVLEDRTSRLARIDVRYPAGSADDPPGKAGLAHLAEHLLYEFDVPRTTGSGSTSLYAEFGRVATAFNASTTADYLHFESQGLPSALPELMRLEAMRMTAGCEAIRPEVFAREKEVVLNELRQRLGADGGDLRSDILAALYPPDHPYRAVDSVQTVATLTQADVCVFMADPLRRGRATLVVSGNVDADAVRELVKETFAKVPSRYIDENSDPWQVPATGGKEHIRGDVPEGSVIFAWPLPAEGTREYRLLQMVRPGMEAAVSRLALDGGWGHSAETWVAGGGDVPFLMLQVTLRSMKDVGAAEKALKTSVQGALHGLGFAGNGSNPWWQRRLVSSEAAMLAQYEMLASRAHMYSGFLFYETELSLLVEKLKELRSSSPKEVRGLAEAWLNAQHAKVIVIEPHEDAGSVSGGTVKSAFVGGHPKTRGVEASLIEADTPIELPLSGTGLAIDTTRYQMGNGLKVVFWEHGEMPLLHARLVTHSGSAMDPRGKEGTALVSGFTSIREGSMTYGTFNVATMIDELLAKITVELRSPGRTVSTELRAHLQSRLKLRGSEPRRAFRQRMRSAVFGREHPYARPSMTSKSIKTMTRDRVLGWARKHIVPKNSTLILTGRFNPTEAKNWIDFFVDQTSSGSRARAIGATPQSEAPAWIAGQSSDTNPSVEVDVRFTGSNGVGRDHAARLVVASILSAKLAAMREDHGISYGMSATYVPQAAGGYWRISGAVDASRAREAGALLRATLENVRSGTSAWRSEFVLGRRKRVDGLFASASDSRSIAERLVFIERFGLGDDYFDKLARAIASLTLDDVERVVSNELGPTQQITGAFGQESAVTEFLSAMKEGRD